MRLDHLSYAAGPEGLAACVQRLGSRLGAGFTDGGIHPAFGTRNFVLPLTGGCYLEVVDTLDHPAVDAAPFGRAVRARSADGGGWLAWALAVDDMAPVEAALGRDAAPGHRRRPDGVDLRWRQIGLNDVADSPELPFFVHWEVEPGLHPSAVQGHPSAVTLRRLEIAGDEAAVTRYLGMPARDTVDGVVLDWIDTAGTDPSVLDERGLADDARGLVAAVFDTPFGELRLD